MLRTIGLILFLVLSPGSGRADERPAASLDVVGAFHALNVADAETVSAWYCRMLDLDVAWRFEATDPASTIHRQMLLSGMGVVLEIVELREPQGQAFSDSSRDPTELGIIKIGFVVADLDAAETRLRAEGAPFLFDPFRSSVSGLRTFAVRDPEGNAIQMFGP